MILENLRRLILDSADGLSRLERMKLIVEYGEIRRVVDDLSLSRIERMRAIVRANEIRALLLGEKAGKVESEGEEQGPFGPVFRQFYHDAQGAIAHLKQVQGGEAVAALHHPDIGDIDLPWGKPGTNQHNGYGLSKLVMWHSEVLSDLQGIIESMAVVDRSDNRVQLESEVHKGAVRLQWDGETKNWLLTAYEKRDDAKGGRRSGADPRTDTATENKADDSPPSASDIQSLDLDAPGGKADLMSNPEDDESDDPNSPNYRFRDTGLIDGARKMNVTESFRAAVKVGQLIRWQSIDWEDVEANPRRAKELITKSNLFGRVDWSALRESGMDPGAAFLIDRVYASIGKEPPEDNRQSRQDYARGIESVRERLETCRTPDQIKQTLDEMREEWRGVLLSPSESGEYQAARAEYDRLRAAYKSLEDEGKSLADAAYALKQKLDGLKSDQYRYGRKRKGRRDPEIDAKIAALEPFVEAAYQALRDFRDANNMITKSRQAPGGIIMYLNDHEWEIEQARRRAGDVKQVAMSRNLVENPVTRSWIALGERFHSILTGKSDSFAGHRSNVRTGKINDWSWAEKDAPSAPKTTKRAAQFQLQVADEIERVGGAPIEVKSTHDLKDRFGLRDVQSGNWVLKDPESAHWHVQQAAGAFLDLSDLLGVDPKTVAMNGRLALAFGARGTGNAGFGGAARAHYEPVERVINITKMKGGGTLAHEWFHGLDNLISEAHGAGLTSSPA